MTTTRIKPNGIVRNRSLNEFQDGDCQEIINMRFREGAWRPVGSKSKVYNALADEYLKIWIHYIDTTKKYVGLNDNYELRLVDINTGQSSLIAAYGGDVDVQFIKRMMIVTGTAGDTYIWSENAYIKVETTMLPELTIEETSASMVDSGQSTTAEGLVGQYRAKIAELTQDSFIVGAISFRLAWKLYDGSFINHTIPEIFLSDGNYQIRRTTNNTGADPYNFRQIRVRKFKAKYSATWVNPYDNLNKDIYTSLCVFMSKPETYYKIDTDTITDDKLKTFLPSGINLTTLSQMGTPTTEDWSKLADPPSWYLVKEINLSELQGLIEYEKDIDLKGFMNDYASKQILNVDSFSHHKISGKVGFTYNDRLILGATTTVFGPGDIGLSSFLISPDSSYTLVQANVVGKIGTIIKTDNGERAIYNDQLFNIYSKRGQYHIIIGKAMVGNPNLIIGYQDARASRIDLLLPDAGPDSWKLFGSIALTKSKHDNYAYYHANNYEMIVITSPNLGTATTLNANQTTLYDENRVQVSELRNPLVYPARNSYQVGTGEIVGFGANTEPLSTGQYGQFPLSVFTTKGIWALEQGQGDVVFASLAPAGGEIVLSKDQIVSVGSGVVFTTSRGIRLMSGLKVVEISTAVEGAPLLTFQENPHYQYFLSNSNLTDLLSTLSTVSLMSYLKHPGTGKLAKIGFDKINSELIVTNDSYDYSYVFNFESNTWHKISSSYKLLINDYPELVGITQEGVYNLSVEATIDGVDILLTSQPQSLTLPEVYKKIERSVLRIDAITTLTKYITFALFASDDLRTWQFITGGQRTGDINNILLTRSHGSAKYYIWMIAANVTLSSMISSVDITVSPRLERKLRK